jgi:integrase
VFTHLVYFTRPVRHGVPLAPRWVSGAFQKLLAGSGLPAMHLHSLRHSWATAALEAGEHLRAVADHLGHADTAVTDRTYTHTVRRVQDLTALRVAGLIASKRGGGS